MEKEVSVCQSHTSQSKISTHRVIWSIENFRAVVQDMNFFSDLCVHTFDTDGIGSVKPLSWQLDLKRKEKCIDVSIKLITMKLKDFDVSGTAICSQLSLQKLTSLPLEPNEAPVYISDGSKIFNVKDLTGGLTWSRVIKLKNIKELLDEGTLHLKLEMKVFYKNSPEKTLTSCLEDFHRRSIPETADVLLNAFFKESIPFNEVKIVTGDSKELQTRWGVLAARSPVFKANYLAEMEERKTGIIKMTEMSGKAVEVLLHFIEKGELLPAWKDDDVIVELTNAAAMYELADLLKFLDETIGIIFDLECKDKPSLENIWKLLSLAHKLSLKNAEKALVEWIVGWIRKESIGCAGMGMGSAENIFKAVSIWSELQKTETVD